VTDYVFQCDHCGTYVSADAAVTYYVPQRDLDDGRVLVVVGVYCGRYCGEKGATWRSVG
jgi:hypothetical protein